MSGGYLSVTKFSQHQHYKNRRPPWIKFYTSLVNPSHPLNKLPIEARYLFDRMLLLAAEWDNSIPNDPELIARLVAMPPRKCRESLALLVKGRWLSERKTMRRASANGASKSFAPETETELEKERDTYSPVDKPVDNGGRPVFQFPQLKEVP
jgi:hypothetical protein